MSARRVSEFEPSSHSSSGSEADTGRQSASSLTECIRAVHAVSYTLQVSFRELLFTRSGLMQGLDRTETSGTAFNPCIIEGYFCYF
jgi:hypothetical protein